MLRNYPGPIEMTLVQCPDPQFKTRNHKRRIVQPQLAQAIANLTAPGGFVYLSSDILEVSANMRDIFEAFTSDVLHMAPVHTPIAAQTSPTASPAQSSSDGETCSESVAADDAADGAAMQPAAWLPPFQGEPQSSPRTEKDHDDPAASRTANGDRTPWAQFEWLPDNPMGLPTERELSVLKYGDPMFRMLLCKPLLP